MLHTCLLSAISIIGIQCGILTSINELHLEGTERFLKGDFDFEVYLYDKNKASKPAALNSEIHRTNPISLCSNIALHIGAISIPRSEYIEVNERDDKLFLSNGECEYYLPAYGVAFSASVDMGNRGGKTFSDLLDKYCKNSKRITELYIFELEELICFACGDEESYEEIIYRREEKIKEGIIPHDFKFCDNFFFHPLHRTLLFLRDDNTKKSKSSNKPKSWKQQFIYTDCPLLTNG